MKQQGLLALFEKPDDLIQSIAIVRDANYQKIDAYTPFPVHGLEKALGLKRSKIPYATLLFALVGCALGFFFQAWASAVSWPVNIGGKPYVSWPAFIPITFEAMVLLGGVLTFFTLMAVLKLPQLFTPILHERLSSDRFGLFVCKTDPHFDGSKLNQIFKECHAVEVKEIG